MFLKRKSTMVLNPTKMTFKILQTFETEWSHGKNKIKQNSKRN